MGWHWWETSGLVDVPTDLRCGIQTCIDLDWTTSGYTDISTAPEKAQESLKNPTWGEALNCTFQQSYLDQAFQSGACSSEGLAQIWWCPESLWQLFSCLVHSSHKDCSIFLCILLLNISKDSSERDKLRVNSTWMNKTLQTEHCCWSLNREIFWLHHLIQHTRDNELYSTCNTPSFLLLLAIGHCKPLEFMG